MLPSFGLKLASPVLKYSSRLSVWQGCWTTESKNDLWKEVLDKEGPLESRGIRGETNAD